MFWLRISHVCIQGYEILQIIIQNMTPELNDSSDLYFWLQLLVKSRKL